MHRPIAAQPADQIDEPTEPTLGNTDYTAPNPPFGATFTYYLSEAPSTERETRRTTERELRERAENFLSTW